MKNPIDCCDRDCPNRSPTYHATCKKYADKERWWQKERTRRRRWERDHQVDNFDRASYWKMKGEK